LFGGALLGAFFGGLQVGNSNLTLQKNDHFYHDVPPFGSNVTFFEGEKTPTKTRRGGRDKTEADT
ncbi:MAG: hypothetical protein LBQ55_11385, partial [Treponema sp.]|nr:hypothetical protein [Treponema sp.]